MGGEMALTGLQRGFEATRGTAVAATALVPIMQGMLVEHVESDFPDENRVSFVRNYRDFALKNYVEMAGIQVRPTFEDIGSWLKAFLKGVSTTGSTVAVTGKAYTFTPTVASDDLDTLTLEVLDPTQDYKVNYCIGNKLELGFAASGPMTMSMDFLGQKATAASRTGSLGQPAYEDIVGAAATWQIDTTTIGTTNVFTVLDGKFTIDNGWVQEFVLDGNIFPRGAHRGSSRFMQLDLTTQFLDLTELNKFKHTGAGNVRKIRCSVDGSEIAGSTGPINRNLQLDWYGVWEAAPFDSVGGQKTLKLTGRSEYNVTAGWDWRAVVTHALSPLV